MLWINKINKGCILSAFFSTLLILSLSSCINDSDDCDVTMKGSSSYHELKLSFVIPNAKVATRADSAFVDGSGYENQIDINNHDYRIYFFSYSGDTDESAGTLLSQFVPTRTTSSSSSSETLYTVTGVLPDELLELTSFRVVVLANWGSYPEVVEGQTTIDGLTEGTYSTFLAQDKFSLNADNLIPFYGVQEFSNVTFEEGGTTTLSTSIGLLRALAKIEIILNDDDDELTFSEVTLNNYNSEGYSAPEGIYLSSQYNTGNLENDYVQSLHLVNGANDTDEKTISFIKTKDREVDASGVVTQYETWELYIPEYNNMGEDFSYITAVLEGGTQSNTIYFATYEGGVTDAYDSGGDTSSRLNIHRNNLYRFNVSVIDLYVSIDVDVLPWVERLDNVEF